MVFSNKRCVVVEIHIRRYRFATNLASGATVSSDTNNARGEGGAGNANSDIEDRDLARQR